jgi:hypothetical protein
MAAGAQRHIKPNRQPVMQIALPDIFPLPVDLFPAIEILFLKFIPLPVFFIN